MTESERIAHINGMTRLELCRIWRFADTGHPLLQELVGLRFKARMDELGGFTPEISKSLGWSGRTLSGIEFADTPCV